MKIVRVVAAVIKSINEKGQLYDVDWLPADVTLIDKIKKNI